MKKYGFVYIWRDRKHNRYYIGSHWGTEHDGYVCSSPWMRQAYKKRPHDFKRKILSRVNSTRHDLLKEEFRYLSMIKPEEIKVRYYNLNITSTGHWAAYPKNVKGIREKISIRTKEAMQRPDVRHKFEEGLKTRGRKGSDPETIEKRRQSMIKTMAEKFPEENRRKALTKEERREYYSNKAKIMHAKRTEEQRTEVYKKIAQANTGKKMRVGQTNTDEHRKKISESLKGKTHDRYMIMIDGIVYASTTKASEALSISVATIGRRLKSNKYPEYIRYSA